MHTKPTVRLVVGIAALALLSAMSHAQSTTPPASPPGAPAPAPVPAPGGVFDPGRPLTAEPDTTAFSRVVADPRLTTFTALIKATGQESLLRSETVTVLAPINEALKAMGAGEVERLMKPENTEELRKFVRGHVLLQVVPSNKLTTSGRLRAFGGRRLLPKLVGGRIDIEGAKVVQADVTASNGVVHLIDAVIRIPAGTLLEVIEKDPSLSRFTQMLKLSGRDAVLAGRQNLTILVPSDEAIARLSPAAINDLMNPEKRTDLVMFVSRHMFAGMIFSESLGTIASSQQGIPSMAGDPLHSEVKDGKPLFNKTARLVKADIETSNGVVHVIDDVLRFIPWGDEAPKVPEQPASAPANTPTPAPAK